MPVFGQPQFQTQTQSQPWRSLPVTYPATTPTADLPTATSAPVGRGWVVGAIGWGPPAGGDPSFWQISSNKARSTTDAPGVTFPLPGSPPQVIAYVETGGSDGAVEVTTATGVYDGVAFRIIDGLNYFILGSGGLQRVTAGNNTDIGGFSASAGDWKAVLSGSSIACWLNGSLITTVTDTQGQTATQHGVFSQRVNGLLDDFSFTPSGAGVTVTDSFNRADTTAGLGSTDTGQLWNYSP